MFIVPDPMEPPGSVDIPSIHIKKCGQQGHGVKWSDHGTSSSFVATKKKEKKWFSDLLSFAGRGTPSTFSVLELAGSAACSEISLRAGHKTSCVEVI